MPDRIKKANGHYHVFYLNCLFTKMYNWQKTALISGFLYHIHKPGAYLLSRKAVPSALEGLTAGFGMGPGVSPLTKHQIYEYDYRFVYLKEQWRLGRWDLASLSSHLPNQVARCVLGVPLTPGGKPRTSISIHHWPGASSAVNSWSCFQPHSVNHMNGCYKNTTDSSSHWEAR